MAPVNLVRRVLEYATSLVPANRIMQGMPLYGYDWPLPDTPETLAATVEHLAKGAEIVTVLTGVDAPISRDELDTHVPDGVEVEIHDGGQPSWWWLLAAQ